MRIYLYASFISFIWLGGLSTGHAQQYQPPPKPTLHKAEGKPFAIEFADGRIAQYMVEKDGAPFVTSLVLTENACANRQSAVCEIRFPRQTMRYVLVWIKNPGFEGKPVYRASGTAPDVRLSAMSSGANDFRFMKKGQTLATGSLNSPFAEMKCDHQDWIPWKNQSQSLRTTQIAGWDEDFELNNPEFLYFRQGDAPSFNAISGRYEGISLVETNGKILLSAPKTGHDLFGGAMEFPLVGYKLQLTFPSQSLADKDDVMCQAKLTINFTQIFTEFTRLFTQDGKQLDWDLSRFRPLIVGSYEYQKLSSYLKEEGQWSYGEYR
jgi:hypothetical protein